MHSFAAEQAVGLHAEPVDQLAELLGVLPPGVGWPPHRPPGCFLARSRTSGPTSTGISLLSQVALSSRLRCMAATVWASQPTRCAGANPAASTRPGSGAR